MASQQAIEKGKIKLNFLQLEITELRTLKNASSKFGRSQWHSS